MLAAVSNAIVRTYRDVLGRGPTRVRSHFVNQAGLLCILQDTLTPSERRLIELGRHEQVQAMRAALAQSMAPELRAAVEAATARRVTGLVSGFDPWDDTASETFLFAEPE